MIRSTLKYSILCGVFLTALFFVSLNFGSNPLLDVRHFIFDLAVFFLFIFFAGKEYKDFRNEGYLHFWQGISIGFIVFIPAVLLFSFCFYVIFEQYPELIDGYKRSARAMIEDQWDFFSQELSEDQLNDQLTAVDAITTAQLVLMTVPKKLLTAFLITPVVSIILRKKPK